MDQLARAAVVGGQRLCRHYGFDDLARRHGRDRVTQDIMDAPTAFARLKPVVALAGLTLRPRCGLCARIEQSKRRVHMRQVGAMLLDLTLKMLDHLGNLHAFRAQDRDNGHSHHRTSLDKIGAGRLSVHPSGRETVAVVGAT